MRYFSCFCLALAFICLSLQRVVAQRSAPRWEVSILYGIEKKDKRVPERNRASLQASMDYYNPEDWGSYAYALGLQHRWGTDRRLHFSSGLGFEQYVQTTRRYFDMSQADNKVGFDIYFDTHRYYKWNVFASQTFHYRITRFLELNCIMRLNFDIYTEMYFLVDESYDLRFDNSKFGFYGLEAMPGLAFTFGRFSLGASIRALNFRRVDTILYGPKVHFDIPQYIEFVNPLRINFFTSYRFHSS